MRGAAIGVDADGPALEPGVTSEGRSNAEPRSWCMPSWIGLTVLGSLLHLLALLLRVRDLRRGMPAPHPVRDVALTAAATFGVAVAAAADLGAGSLLDRAGETVLLAAYILLGARVALLAARVIRTARPRI